MPGHQASGFTAAVGVLNSHTATPSGFLHPPRYCALPELGLMNQSSTETACFVRAEQKQAFRLFFARDAILKPISTLECYVALLYIDDDDRPWTKVYAVGPGVLLPVGGHSWYLDGSFSEGGQDNLQDCLKSRLLLSLHAATLKQGTILGDGKLNISDVLWSNDEPVARFKWHYLLNPDHVTVLGLDQDSSADAQSASNATCPSPDPAVAFLRRTNSLLVSLLTPAQRLDFLRQIAESSTITSMVSPATKTELDTALAILTQRMTVQHQVVDVALGSQDENQPIVAKNRAPAPKRSTSVPTLPRYDITSGGPWTLDTLMTRGKARAAGISVDVGPSGSLCSPAIRSPTKLPSSQRSPRKRTRTEASEGAQPGDDAGLDRSLAHPEAAA